MGGGGCRGVVGGALNPSSRGSSSISGEGITGRKGSLSLRKTVLFSLSIPNSSCELSMLYTFHWCQSFLWVPYKKNDPRQAPMLYTLGLVSLQERLVYTLNKLFAKQAKSFLLLLDLDPFILQCSPHNIEYIKFTSP